MSRADRLLLRAILHPSHRAEDEDLTVLLDRDLTVMVLQQLPNGWAVGPSGLSLLGARGVIERHQRAEASPVHLLGWATAAREVADV